jgi:zinc-finger of transposase IS204/IS1001/IS1096/IS1165/Transposase
MQDDLTRLVGLEGFEVKRVVEVGGQLDLEVELVARAGCCPRCGRASLDVKDRPRVRVRDLPIAGRVTHLVWRKRRYPCAACGWTFTESHPELPARQRVTRRFRRRLFERVRGGGAHAEMAREERTTRYQVARAFGAGAEDELEARREARPVRRLSLDEAHHCRGRELATVVSDLDRRRVVELLDGRSRRRIERYLRSLPEPSRRAIEVVSIDPYETLPPGDPQRAAVGAGSWSTTSTWCAAPTPRSTRSGAKASPRPPTSERNRAVNRPICAPMSAATSPRRTRRSTACFEGSRGASRRHRIRSATYGAGLYRRRDSPPTMSRRLKMPDRSLIPAASLDSAARSASKHAAGSHDHGLDRQRTIAQAELRSTQGRPYAASCSSAAPPAPSAPAGGTDSASRARSRRPRRSR